MTDAQLLARFYGCAKVAQMVLDGQLGQRERSVARARAHARIQMAGDAQPTHAREAAAARTTSARVTEEQRHAEGRRASAPNDTNKHIPKRYAPVETMRQRRVPAPLQRDGLVAQALASMPDFQRAWGRAL